MHLHENFITVLCLGTMLYRARYSIESGNQEPRRQFIAKNLFLPTSDRKLVEDTLAVILASPRHVAASAM